MAQISRRKLNVEVEKRIFEVFWTAFEKVERGAKLQSFVSDLLTDTEKVVLAKRLAIALMLSKGYSYAEIGEFLKVTPPTIARVRSWMSSRGGGLKHALEQVTADNEAAKFWESIREGMEDLLLTPAPGANWSKLGKLKYQVSRKRGVKKEVGEKL